jgi:hypothetical protein
MDQTRLSEAILKPTVDFASATEYQGINQRRP